MLVYLGGPIDLVSDGERSGWREMMKNELASRGISSFDPAAAFRYMPHSDDARVLIDINKKAMCSCDFAVFVMGSTMPSVGTPIELYMATQYGINHCVIWEPDHQSFRSGESVHPVAGNLPAYVKGFAQHVFHRFDVALDHIVEHKKRRVSVGSVGDTRVLGAHIGVGGRIADSFIHSAKIASIDK
jgi:hypothetical protein